MAWSFCYTNLACSAPTEFVEAATVIMQQELYYDERLLKMQRQYTYI